VSQDARRARRAGKIVLQIYREHAPLVAEAAAKMGVTCKKGCSHCCMLPATATVPEMVPVVEYLASRSDWPRRRPALERELARQLRVFASINVLDDRARSGFFQRQMPCVFLKDHHCQIYPVRPAVCRYHLAITPPENCAHGAADPTVARVDLRKIENDVVIEGARVFGELIGGPIALAFVIAADQIGVKLDIDRDLIERIQTVRVGLHTGKLGDVIATARDEA
jgi:Fe-S-cluster containining protein